MFDRPIIDFHAHVFPDALAEKASRNLGAYYGHPMPTVGFVAELRRSIDEVGDIQKILLHSTATKKSQVTGINDYISALVRTDGRFLGFGTLHPEFENPAEEVERIAALGLLGIKLHSDFQGFKIDDESAYPLYEAARGKLPILFHMGDENTDGSSPKRLARVLDRFPGLSVIAAHLGGYTMWDEAVSCLAERDVRFDVSSVIHCLPGERVVEIIRIYGAERCFFGTDFPMHRHRIAIEQFLTLGLTQSENDMILHRNAKAFLEQLTEWV